MHTNTNAITITLNLNTALSIAGKNFTNTYAIAIKPIICNTISILVAS